WLIQLNEELIPVWLSSTDRIELNKHFNIYNLIINERQEWRYK
ncbi:19725_t:CDS:1, partial [Gigaspora margarita]